MNNLETIVWPGFKKLCPSVRLGGIYANKRGYHNKRENLPATDYSVRQFERDREGPDDEPAAIDLTFPDAQRGDYSTIKVYSKRLLVAGRTGDPRTRGWREFFGNTDDDREVEGWDFAKNRPSSSDTSHLWHVHLSEHRDSVEKIEPAHAILSILSGESLSAYIARTSRKVEMLTIGGKLPELEYGDSNETVPGGTEWVSRAQVLLDWITPNKVTVDGEYGDQTAAAVKKMMEDDPARSSTNGRKIGLPEWRRLYGIWG